MKSIPVEDADRLLNLPDECRIDEFGAMDQHRSFADVWLSWNEFGLALQVEVRGKDQEPQCSATRPRTSDGVTLWIDTRDARTSHRASRYCHQFHFLPTGGGEEEDEPVFAQSKINRALQDAPHCQSSNVSLRGDHVRGGYRIEAFLPEAVLHGFDPDQNRRLGFYYAVHDGELGDQVLAVGAEFPYGEDPSLWPVLELVK
jgi:hypothetical protein